MEQKSRELKTSSDQSEFRDIEKDSWENTGRESSLYRWSSVTETIQFAESDSSMDITGTATSRSTTGTPTRDKQDSYSRLSTDNRSSSTGDEITTETNEDELYQGYSEDEFELSEESDEMDRKEELKDDFLHKKLQILTTKRFISPANAKVPILEDEVDMEYCKKKIQLLNKKQTCGQEKCKKIGIKVPKDIKAEPCQLENARNVERMKINNIFKMNKDVAPAHQPRKCKMCRKLQGQITEGSFIRKKTGILKKQQLESKIENHLYEKDSATLIAEIINSGPKPSDPPQEIWDRLLRKEYS